MATSEGKARMRKTKAPKLRFKPLCFYRNKKSGQLYWCRYVFRRTEEPHIWLFMMEERTHMADPSTGHSVICETLGPSHGVKDTPQTQKDRVFYEPIKAAFVELCPNDFLHGDQKVVDNKTMIHDFELVSSGEIS